MESAQVAIVIPAYNEAKTIKKVISELNDELAGYNFRVIVVNDCSIDETRSEALTAGALVLDLDVNHGYAGAIEKGLNYVSSLAEFKYALTMDADGQHHPRSVRAFIELLESDSTAMIIGKREKAARFGEWLFSRVHSFLLGVKDPLCGLKLYSLNDYRKIGYFDSYDSIGTELMVNLIKNGVKYNQVEIEIRDREDAARFGNGIKVEFRLIKSLIRSIKHIIL